MTTLPEMCMQYTEVFTTWRLEMGFAVVAGMAIGWWLGDR